MFEHATHDAVVSILHMVSYMCGFFYLLCVCVLFVFASLPRYFPHKLTRFPAQSIHFFAPSLSPGSSLVLLLNRPIHTVHSSIPRSLAPSLPRSLAPSLPRSLAPSLPRSLAPSLSAPWLSRLSFHSQLSSSLIQTFFCFKVSTFRITYSLALSLMLSRPDSPLALNTHI